MLQDDKEVILQALTGRNFAATLSYNNMYQIDEFHEQIDNTTSTKVSSRRQTLSDTVGLSSDCCDSGETLSICGSSNEVIILSDTLGCASLV